MRACGRCLMLKEWDDDALHDGRPAGPASGRRDDVGSPPPRGVRGMSGRGGGAVPACRAAQGAAGAPAGARPLARRARGGARRTPAAAQPLGPVEPRGGGGRGRAHRAPSDLDQPAGRGRARPREAAVRDAGAGVGALRPRRPRDQRPVGGARGRPGRPHCADRRGADAAGPTDPGPPRGTRETLAAAGGPDAAAHERPRLPRQLRGAVRPRRILSMQRKWIVTATAALAAWPGGLVAQQPPRAPRAPRVFTYSVTDNRGRIGVVVRTDADPETDKVGAKIEGVTPGGPADKAGLKVGDIITKFNGTSLAAVKAEDEDQSGPGTKLVELARKLTPDDTVQVEYRRGNDTKQATLVAADLGPRFQMEMPGPPDIALAPMLGMDHFEMFGSPWGDLELVSLNSDLGEYFGAKDGVLVVKAPADSTLPLKGGDVITSIGGRKPANPSHAMRILRSYETGETVSIEILRKQKRMSLTWKVPAREDRFFRMHREREEHEDQSGLRHLQLRRRVHLQRA